MLNSTPTNASETTTAAPMESTLPPLLTTKQAAALANCGERTLWAWSRSGICPPGRKIGMGRNGAVRFSRDEMLRWIAEGCQPVDERAPR